MIQLAELYVMRGRRSQPGRPPVASAETALYRIQRGGERRDRSCSHRAAGLGVCGMDDGSNGASEPARAPILLAVRLSRPARHALSSARCGHRSLPDDPDAERGHDRLGSGETVDAGPDGTDDQGGPAVPRHCLRAGTGGRGAARRRHASPAAARLEARRGRLHAPLSRRHRVPAPRRAFIDVLRRR